MVAISASASGGHQRAAHGQRHHHEEKMSSTPDVAQPPAQRARVDAVTRSAVTIIIAITALVSFVFSFGNVTLLCLSVGIPRTIAWLVSPAVDLSVTGLLLATNALVQRRPASGRNAGMRLWKPA
jgi:hypothetical protein